MRDKNGYRTWTDSFWTLSASGAVILLTILVTAILPRQLPVSEFEDFLFIRRFIALLFPVFTLSAGAGLTWLLASTPQEGPEHSQALKGTTLLIIAINLLLFAVAYILPDKAIRDFIFPVTGNFPKLWIITIFWLISYSAYILLFSLYRGILDMAKANMLNLVCNGIIPVCSLFLLILLKRLSVSSFLSCWAFGYFLSYFWLLAYAGNIFTSASESLKFSLKTVFSYAFPRVPAGFLLSFPAYIIPFFLMRTGCSPVFFLSALLVLQTLSYLTDPLGQVFLPNSAKMSSEKDSGALSEMSGNFMTLCIQIGFFVSFQIFLLAGPLTHLWFGDEYMGAVLPMRILAFSAIPCLLYTPLRSIIDGVEKKALITHFLAYNSILCILATFILAKMGRLGNASGAVVIAASNWSLCLMLFLALRKRVKLSLDLVQLAESFAIAAFCGGIGYLLSLIGFGSPTRDAIFLLTASSASTAAVFLFWTILRKPGWWISLRKEIT